MPIADLPPKCTPNIINQKVLETEDCTFNSRHNGFIIDLNTALSTPKHYKIEVETYGQEDDEKMLLLKNTLAQLLKTSNININDKDETLDTLIKQLAKINYEDVEIEITPLNSIKFVFKLKKPNHYIRITKPLEKYEKLNAEDVITSLIINDECVLNDVLPITKVIEGINRLNLS